MRKLFLAMTAVVALAGSASAADMAVKAPLYKAPPPVYSWTGCYVGAGAGYGLYDLDTHLADVNGGQFGVPLDQAGRGWFGTAQFGCDYQVSSSWVIGAFVDGDWGRIRGKHTGEGSAIGLISGDMTLKWSWAVGGRIGYLVTPSLLTYVSGGFTQAKFSGTTYATAANVADGFAVPDQKYNGYFIGSGVEYAFNWLPGLYWKTEYRFADYRTQSLGVFSTSTGALTGTFESTHPYVHTVRTELVWRFGPGPVVAKY